MYAKYSSPIILICKWEFLLIEFFPNSCLAFDKPNTNLYVHYKESTNQKAIFFANKRNYSGFFRKICTCQTNHAIGGINSRTIITINGSSVPKMISQLYLQIMLLSTTQKSWFKVHCVMTPIREQFTATNAIFYRTHFTSIRPRVKLVLYFDTPSKYCTVHYIVNRLRKYYTL